MRHAAQLVQSVPFRWLIVLLAVLVAGFYSLEAVDACEAAQHRLSSLTSAWTQEPLLVLAGCVLLLLASLRLRNALFHLCASAAFGRMPNPSLL